MYYKVKITKNPKAKTGMQVPGSVYNNDSNSNYNKQYGKNNIVNSKYITSVPREEANLEAEGGETVYGDLNGDTFPEHKIIKGPRHTNGGVPLKLPEDSFIFSDTNAMKINDPNILQMFNQSVKKGKGLTPATLAKQYDIDSYRKILQDPNSDKIAIKTAELMIINYNLKLGALALAQEAKKGFPQGIPEMAKPYMEYVGIKEEDLLPPELPEPQASQEQMQPQQMQQQMPQEEMPQEEMQPEDMQQIEQPFPDQMSRFGGQRRLRRAQEGMQQPSPEEMAMMEQEQAQQEQGGNQMGQIIEQVGQALKQGAQPEEVAAQLIQSQIPPEQVVQIFVQLGMPQQQVQELITGVIQQMQGGQEQQIDPRQEQQISQEEMMAMQEQDPQQMQQAPMAMYGMQMGGYNMPFSNPSYSYADGGSIPRYVGGGEPPKGQIVKRSDYADDAAYQIGLRKAKIRADRNKEDIYTLKADGTYVKMKVSAKQDAAYTGDATGWSGKNAVAARYVSMENALKDEATAKLFADATRKALLEKESYRKKGLGTAKYNPMYESLSFGKVADLTDKEIVDYYLDHQKRNMQLQASGYESYLYNDINGNLRRKNTVGDGKGDNKGFVDIMQGLKKADGSRLYTDAEIETKFTDMTANAPTLDAAFIKLGIPIKSRAKGSGDEKKALLEQATFVGYNQLMNDVKNGKITDEDQLVKLMNFQGNIQRGYSDENVGGVSDISPIDAWYTNTTSGQISNYSDYQFDEIPEIVKDPPEDPKDPKKPNNPILPVPPSQWWLQDTIKTAGAASDLMGINKYMPWAPKIDLEEPRPTFLDPTRELAQQSEDANIAIQGLSQFAGPQALSARASSIQSGRAKQAGDTLSRYNNANINLADQFEFKSVDIRNQEAIGNQASQSKMYDQNTIANQQYDNSKLALQNLTRNLFTNAITNKTKTSALNQLYPQYYINPATGGEPGYGYGKQQKPETTKTANQYYEEMMADNPDADEAVTWKRATAMAGQQTSTSNQLDIIDEQYSIAKKFGGRMQNGGFIYTTTFPY